MKVKKTAIFAVITTILLALLILAAVYVFYPSYFKAKFANQFMHKSSIFLVDNDFIKEYISEPQYSMDVLNYDVNLKIDFADERIDADTKLKLILLKEINDKLILNFNDNLEINSAKILGTDVDYSTDEHHLILELPKEYPDTINLEIKYSGKPDGGLIFDDNEERASVYTINEPVLASEWMPCNDLLTDKALLRISITTDSTFKSISNGKMVSRKVQQNKSTYTWQTVYPIATYLIAVYSANYSEINDQFISSQNDTLKLKYFAFPSDSEAAKKDFSVHKDILKAFNSYFGEYPFIKEKYSVIEFAWPYGAIENQTATGFSKKFVGGFKFFTNVLTHELAHQWWGDAVTPKAWKDIWLNEGFATYSEALFYEFQSDRKALISTMLSKLDYFDNTTLYNPEYDMFSKTIYEKGAWVLHMLRGEIGDSAFFSTMRNYYNTYKYKNASTFDFIKIAESESQKDLDTFFDQWVFKGKGILEVDYDYKIDSLGVQNFDTDLVINQVQEEFDKYKFSLQIEVSDSLGNIKNFKFYIESKDSSINLPTKFKPNFVKLDPQKWLMADFVKKKIIQN